MGLFGGNKKSGDSYKTLTEREIQQRLYGHLRQPSVTTEVADKVKEKHKAVSLTPILDSKSTLESPAQAKPAVTKTAHDLFVKPVSQEPAVSRSETAASAVKPKSFSSSSASKTSFDHTKKPNPLKPLLNSALGFGTQLLGLLGKAAASILGLVFGIARSINFKSPVTRKVLTAGLIAAAIAGIFVGIHYLNLNREAAMKQPYKPRPAVQQAPALVQAAPVAAPAAATPSPLSVPAETTAAEDAEDLEATPAAETKTPAETAAPKAAVKSKKNFGIQVATFALREDGSKLITKLEAEGFEAFLKPMTRPTGRVFQSVYLGPYGSFQEAQLDLARFKKKEIAKSFQDAFVRSV